MEKSNTDQELKKEVIKSNLDVLKRFKDNLDENNIHEFEQLNKEILQMLEGRARLNFERLKFYYISQDDLPF